MKLNRVLEIIKEEIQHLVKEAEILSQKEIDDLLSGINTTPTDDNGVAVLSQKELDALMAQIESDIKSEIPNAPDFENERPFYDKKTKSDKYIVTIPKNTYGLGMLEKMKYVFNAKNSYALRINGKKDGKDVPIKDAEWFAIYKR